MRLVLTVRAASDGLDFYIFPKNPLAFFGVPCYHDEGGRFIVTPGTVCLLVIDSVQNVGCYRNE